MPRPADTFIKYDPRAKVPWGVIESYAFLKAALIVGVTAAVGTSFLQSIVVALVSGIIGAIGMIAAARIASKEAIRNREEIGKVSQKIDDAREADTRP